MLCSDYAGRPHPNVMGCLGNVGELWLEGSYGNDTLTWEGRSAIGNLFGVGGGNVFFVPTGSAANRLALAILLGRSYEAVMCAESAHINRHEAGAAASMGHSIIPLSQVCGKVLPEQVESIYGTASDIHAVCPTVLSIANATELGCVYSDDELAVLSEGLFRYRLLRHMDGARLSNAVASGILKRDSLKDILFTKYGFNVLTFGLAKNGGLGGDVVVVQDSKYVDVATRYQKQFGYLQPRMHLYGAQAVALMHGDLWLKNATHANEQAANLGMRLANECRIEPLFPVQTNAVFVAVPQKVAFALEQAGHGCNWSTSSTCGSDKVYIVRFMTSWSTTKQEIDCVVAFLKDKLHQ